MIIDGNAYTGKWPYWPSPHMSDDGLLYLMDRAGVDRAIVTSTRSAMIAPREGNLECARLAARHPDRIAWCCGVTACDEAEALAELERCVDAGAKGVRLAPQHQSWSLDSDPFVDVLVAAAQEHGLPVILPLRLVMDWRLPTLAMAEVAALVARHPGAAFVLSGVNYHDLRQASAVLQSHPRTLIETSCLMGRGTIERLCQAVGAERVLLGLGLPLQSALVGLEKVRHAKIDQRERDLILGENALRLLGLASTTQRQSIMHVSA